MMRAILILGFVLLWQQLQCQQNATSSTDSLKSHFQVSAGFIPYEIGSRCSGGYLSLGTNDFQIEYRALYTFPTQFRMHYLFGESRFFYQGLNQEIILCTNLSNKWKMGICAVYRQWWFSHKWMRTQDYAPSSSYSFMELNSSSVSGFGYGMQFLKKTAVFEPFDAEWVFGFSYTSMNGAITTHETSLSSIGYSEKKTSLSGPILAIGLKLGFTYSTKKSAGKKK